MFKKVMLMLVVILALGILPTFAQDDPYADVDPSGQIVSYWHNHTGGRARALDTIVRVFNNPAGDWGNPDNAEFYIVPETSDPTDLNALAVALAPIAAEYNTYGITVEASNQGGYGDIFEKIRLAIGANEALPNLTVAYQNQAATYQFDSSGESLIDMNLLVNSPTWGMSESEIAAFYEGIWASDVFPTFGGARFGFPVQRSMEVMFFNVDWLAELFANGHISFEGAPTTPEQFREASCAATANPFSSAEADAPEAPVGYEMRIDASNLSAWVFAFGGDIFDYEAGMYTLNTPEAVEAMTFVQGLIADGCARIQTDPRAFSGQRNFGLGTSLFNIASSSGFPFYALAASRDLGDGTLEARFSWSAGAVPHTTEVPVMNLYGASVSITSTTPEQEVATWIFVKLLGSQAVMALWGDAANYFPTRGDAAELLGATFERVPAYAATFDLLQYAYSEPGVPGYDPVRNEMSNALVLLWDFPAGSTPEDVQPILDALDENANLILSEFGG
ncbi:MAG: extracellular solute-binding protein [Phototrophicales bacterium]|nr:extracellular solute-binding protein [Phototrophicales bacterium]